MLRNLCITLIKHSRLVSATNNYVVLLCKSHLLGLDRAIGIESHFHLHVYLEVNMIAMITLNVFVFLLILVIMLNKAM